MCCCCLLFSQARFSQRGYVMTQRNSKDRFKSQSSFNAVVVKVVVFERWPSQKPFHKALRTLGANPAVRLRLLPRELTSAADCTFISCTSSVALDSCLTDANTCSFWDRERGCAQNTCCPSIFECPAKRPSRQPMPQGLRHRREVAVLVSKLAARVLVLQSTQYTFLLLLLNTVLGFESS